MDENDPKLVYMPESDVTKAVGLVRIMEDRWWLVHPERGLVFWKTGRREGWGSSSPQCNPSLSIAEHLAKDKPWAHIKLFERVHVPINAYMVASEYL